MIRFLVIALIVIAAWVLLLKLFREMRGAPIDWKGIAVIAGFVALAFWLRHAVGWA